MLVKRMGRDTKALWKKRTLLNGLLAVSLLPAIKTYAQETAEVPDIPEAEQKTITIGLESYNQRLESRFSLFTHKRTFVLPISYVRNPNQNLYRTIQIEEGNDHAFYSKSEAEFQLSFFLPVNRNIFHSNWDFLVAYTHHSWWQVYNAYWSKPFRETNYNPEVFVRNVFFDQPRFLGITLVALDLGYMHESNGQIQLISRSWDRLFARAILTKGSYAANLTTWLRLPEKKRDDDNPEILKYAGYGKLELTKSIGRPTLSTTLNLAEKPGVEASISYPWNNAFRWFVRVSRGYGQSLIEHDRDTTRYAAGVTLEGYADQR